MTTQCATTYDSFAAAVRLWTPAEEYELEANPVEQPNALTVQQRPVPTTNTNGVHYQRCGGGRRVIRKRIGGS